MRNLVIFFSILLLLLIQDSILQPFRIEPVNLVLLFLVFTVLFSEFDEGLLVALVGGLLLDFVSGVTDGVIALSMVLIFLIGHFILNSLIARESNRIILVSSVATASLLFWTAQSFVLNDWRLLNLAWFTGFNLLFTYPVLKYYSWIHSRLKTKVTAV